jgi:hypothetical protein
MRYLAIALILMSAGAAWTEEGIRIGAEIAELTADRLRLRIQLRSEIKEESYRPAKVPSVCPDMPRRDGPVPGH